MLNNFIGKLRFWDDLEISKDPNAFGLGFAVGPNEGNEIDSQREHVAALTFWKYTALFSFGRKLPELVPPVSNNNQEFSNLVKGE